MDQLIHRRLDTEDRQGFSVPDLRVEFICVDQASLRRFEVAEQPWQKRDCRQQAQGQKSVLDGRTIASRRYATSESEPCIGNHSGCHANEQGDDIGQKTDPGEAKGVVRQIEREEGQEADEGVVECEAGSSQAIDKRLYR